MANLDGFAQQTLISGLNYPGGIALLVPEPSALLPLGLCIAALLRRKRPTRGAAERPAARSR